MQHRRRAHRVAREGRDGGGLRALAADVAEEEARAAGDEREEVVEVAADRFGRERLVVHGHVQTRDEGKARGREAALQRARELLGVTLVAQRLVATVLLALQLAGERLAVGERVQPLLRRLFAIEGRGAAIMRGQLAIRGGLRAALGRSTALSGRTDDRVGARVPACVVLLQGRGIELGHRVGAGRGGLVALAPGEVAALGDRVAPVGGAQPQPRDLVAPAGGHLALARRALAERRG